jgi:membrane-bound ClpP family serine protease
MTMDTQVPGSAPPFTSPSSAQPANGLGVAALVLGVASLVAAVSFVMFPLALPGGLLAAILGAIAVSRGRARGATSHGQAVAGIVCGILALVVAVVFAVRFGTFVANNTSVFTSFDNCIAKAGDRSAVSNCIAQFANDVRP